MIYYNYIVCSTDFALFGEIYLCVFLYVFRFGSSVPSIFFPGSKTSKKSESHCKKNPAITVKEIKLSRYIDV